MNRHVLNHDSKKMLEHSLKVFQNGKATEDDIRQLKLLKSENDSFWGRRASSYAIAILDRLNVEKYIGDDEEILQLIKNL